MKGVNICIIDGHLDLQVLNRLLPHKQNMVSVKQKEVSGELGRFTHGTLCTALLLEELNNLDIAERCHITHYSIEDESGEKSLKGLLLAFEYCLTRQFDLISISVGVLSRTCVEDMLPLLESQNGIVLAAASNRFTLTYPAALPQVIGVKRSANIPENSIQLIQNPVDGIELIANLDTTQVSENVWGKTNNIVKESNSVLVPRLCARTAKLILDNDARQTKCTLLNNLVEVSRKRSYMDYCLPEILLRPEDDQPPSIILPYEKEGFEEIFYKVVILQREFEKNGYSCSVLGDFIKEPNFIRGLYPLEKSSCLHFYQNIIMDGLLLVLVRKENVNDLQGDLLLEDWLSQSAINLFCEILQNFL